MVKVGRGAPRSPVATDAPRSPQAVCESDGVDLRQRPPPRRSGACGGGGGGEVVWGCTSAGERCNPFPGGIPSGS
eukprot:gene20458-biopygen5585